MKNLAGALKAYKAASKTQKTELKSAAKAMKSSTSAMADAEKHLLATQNQVRKAGDVVEAGALDVDMKQAALRKTAHIKQEAVAAAMHAKDRVKVVVSSVTRTRLDPAHSALKRSDKAEAEAAKALKEANERASAASVKYSRVRSKEEAASRAMQKDQMKSTDATEVERLTKEKLEALKIASARVNEKFKSASLVEKDDQQEVIMKQHLMQGAAERSQEAEDTHSHHKADAEDTLQKEEAEVGQARDKEDQRKREWNAAAQSSKGMKVAMTNAERKDLDALGFWKQSERMASAAVEKEEVALDTSVQTSIHYNAAKEAERVARAALKHTEKEHMAAVAAHDAVVSSAQKMATIEARAESKLHEAKSARNRAVRALKHGEDWDFTANKRRDDAAKKVTEAQTAEKRAIAAEEDIRKKSEEADAAKPIADMKLAQMQELALAAETLHKTIHAKEHPAQGTFETAKEVADRAAKAHLIAGAGPQAATRSWRPSELDSSPEVHEIAEA
jgi:colicin import membrane protein